MLREVAVRGAIGFIALAGIAPTWSQAAILSTGLHQLHNHPDADIDPPPYGARLDELYDATLGLPDDFTFDFDYKSGPFNALMLIDVEPAATSGYYTLTITGKAWGGRDVGTAYAADQYQGIYEFYFQYVVGAKDAFGDDDIIVDPTDYTGQVAGTKNEGYVKTPLGDTIYLTDAVGDGGNSQISLRLGNEDDDQGHRGFPGISGWGWLKHGSPPVNVSQSDWIFTVDPEEYIPAPGSIGLLALASVAAVRNRRRRHA